MAEPSPYERERAELIARNRRLLAELGLPEAAQNLSTAVNNSQKSTAKRPSFVNSLPPVGAVRRSERIRRVTGGKKLLVEEEWEEGEEGREGKDGEEGEGGEEYEPSCGEEEAEEEDEDEGGGQGGEAHTWREEEDCEELERWKGRQGARGSKAGPSLAAMASEAAAEMGLDEEELAIQQAMALSLGVSFSSSPQRAEVKNDFPQTASKVSSRSATGSAPPGGSTVAAASATKQRRNGNLKKRKIAERFTLSQEEVDLMFFIFDERGRGAVRTDDIARVATSHDLSWSDDELHDMVALFDADCDGKLNVEDFRRLVMRCNLLPPIV